MAEYKKAQEEAIEKRRKEREEEERERLEEVGKRPHTNIGMRRPTVSTAALLAAAMMMGGLPPEDR